MSTEPAAVPTPYAEQYLRSHDGLRLYARVYDGPHPGAATVLCLHGLTRTCRDFEDLAPHLRSRFRVIAPDLRGRGHSDRDPDALHYQPTVYAQDVLTLLATVGAERVGIVGTSLGGLLAMMLAAMHPARIAGIVLNDVGPEVDPAGAARIRQYAGRLSPVASWAEAVAQARTTYGDAWPGLDAAYWERLARRAYREDDQGVPQLDADPKIGAAFRAAPPAALDLWPVWAALKSLPTLAIRGAHSDILSAATLARMQAEKPDLEVLEIAQRGHVPLLDEPGCLQRIDAFLTSLDFRDPIAPDQ